MLVDQLPGNDFPPAVPGISAGKTRLDQMAGGGLCLRPPGMSHDRRRTGVSQGHGAGVRGAWGPEGRRGGSWREAGWGVHREEVSPSPGRRTPCPLPASHSLPEAPHPLSLQSPFPPGDPARVRNPHSPAGRGGLTWRKEGGLLFLRRAPPGGPWALSWTGRQLC